MTYIRSVAVLARKGKLGNKDVFLCLSIKHSILVAELLYPVLAFVPTVGFKASFLIDLTSTQHANAVARFVCAKCSRKQ